MGARRLFVRGVVVAVVLSVAGVAYASLKFPAPGSASTITSLVAASGSIQKLPTNLLPPLSVASKDTPGFFYGAAGRPCPLLSSCVFAAKASATTIVLYGDSHAMMWLPALVPVAQRAHDRLVLVWRPGCPDATVSTWNPNTHSVDAACAKFRSGVIAAIKKFAPRFVLLADRTSDIPGPNNKPTTNAAWQAGLTQTIAALKSTKTKVAVIGDVTAFTVPLPDCLAASPTKVQACSAPNPNPKTYQHFAAEQAAATAQGVTYVNPQPWLCTSTCSPVIGHQLAYFDNLHVSATYAEFLSTVFGAALKGVLAK